tara:strand:+ start:3732 stop:4766 length:1035 start_codon:yes stop_codon:yes gene_type:complete
MALKDFDDVKPRSKDHNWKQDINIAQMPKKDEFYTFRVVGGVFSYAQHWIEFKNKDGQIKRYPVDCNNWDEETESPSKKGGCPCCELGMRPSVRYMMNAIDREAQGSGTSDPMVALDISPTVMRQLVDLKKLNSVKGTPYSVSHKKNGCDIHLMKQNSKKRGGIEWQVQKGDRAPLDESELSLEVVDFSEYWLEPDLDKIRMDLRRHGYFEGEDSSGGPDSSVVLPSKKKASVSVDDEDDDDDDDVPAKKSPKKKRKAKKPEPEPEDDDEDDDDEDDEEDVPPSPKRRKPKKVEPVEEDDDDDFDDFDDDDEEDTPPKKTKKKSPPVDDMDDDFDDDFDDFDDL